jgi:regulator of extracellular matrix RemA (YlzA/DUF370 family)
MLGHGTVLLANRIVSMIPEARGPEPAPLKEPVEV